MDIEPIIYLLSIFVLAVFVGYYVVWSVTPALHTPLMSVTNAISSVIIVGALIALGVDDGGANSVQNSVARWLGFGAVVLAVLTFRRISMSSACWQCIVKKISEAGDGR